VQYVGRVLPNVRYVGRVLPKADPPSDE
jgi:hypothetical protein